MKRPDEPASTGAPTVDDRLGPPSETSPSSDGEGDDDDGDDALAADSFGAFVQAVAAAPPIERPAAAAPAPAKLGAGSVLGDFELVRLLGQGGMGMVWEARDRRLGRTVAVKLVRLERGARHRALLTEIFTREARATAGLNHPNLVTLHVFGEHEGVCYLVLERLTGTTLAERLQTGAVPLAEAIAILVELLRGLEHAHAQGVIHRDLKPANVFLLASGGVKILDFGMATLADAMAEAEATPDGAPLVLTTLRGGTPAYMAPEQWRGEEQGPATDLWAVGVMLHEMLTGLRPFRGTGVAELATPDLRARHPEAPPRLATLAASLLALDPAKRPAGAAAVRRELEAIAAQGRTRRRRVVAAAAGVGILGAIAGAVVLAQGSGAGAAPKVCDLGEAPLAGVWGAKERAAIEPAFAGVGVSYAADAARGVVEVLDVWAADLLAQHRDACEATKVRKEQSPAIYDQRMRCLEQRRRDGATLIELLRAPSEDDLANAVAAALDLPDPSICGDLDALLDEPAPERAEVHAEVDAIRTALSAVKRTAALGRRAEAKQQVPALIERARATGYQPLLADAYHQLGLLELSTAGWAAAVAAFEEAVLAAEASHADRTAATALSLIVEALASQGKPDEAKQRLRHAEAAIARLGDAPEVNAILTRSRAVLARETDDNETAVTLMRELIAYHEQHSDARVAARACKSIIPPLGNLGRFDEAYAQAEKCLALEEELLGEHHPDVAQTLSLMALLQNNRGAFAEAEKLQRRALAIHIAAEGAENAVAARWRADLGSFVMMQGRVDEARRELETAIEALARLYPPEAEELLEARGSYASVLMSARDYPAAEAALRALIEVRRTLPANRTALGHDLSNLASTLNLAGRPAEAVPLAREALQIAEEAYPAEHPSVGLALLNLADAERLLGEHRDAEPHYRRVLAILEAAIGPDHPMVSFPLYGLGVIAHARRDAAKAIPLLERAVKLRTGANAPVELGEAQAALARALADSGDKPGARARATDALASFEAGGPRADAARTALEAWLAKLPK